METMPPEFWQAVEQFNQRDFYPCHDTLEALWTEADEPQRTFYQGILQIAVACYHLGNQNWRGAVILLGEGLRRICDYPPTYGKLNINHLVTQTDQLLRDLQQAGPERVTEYSQLVTEPEAGQNPANAIKGTTLPFLLIVDS